MIYEAMKGLVEWLVNWYKCECGGRVWEWNIDIVWAAGNTVNFDLICPKCGKHWMIKSQLVLLDQNWLSNIQHSIQDIKEKLIWKSEVKQISDNEIVSLWKDLQEKQINVSDLFS